MRRSASNGFAALSPAWQTLPEIARHWFEIVAGATHAARRACPTQWHVGRLIFISDDPAAVEAYRSGPARSYLETHCPSDAQQGREDVIIAGPKRVVTERIAELIRRVGPFGTLHCIDPGLPADDAVTQMRRLASEFSKPTRTRSRSETTTEMEGA